MTDYVTDFVEESREHITELNNWLLELERTPESEEAIEEIFRIAHTLKGNCGAMGLTAASDLAHAIEDLLEGVRSGDIDVSSELMDTVFAGVDDLETIVEEVATHGETRTDPTETIETLRAHANVDARAPSDEEIEQLLANLERPADGRETYVVRLSLEGHRHGNDGKLVVDALIDAFDLLGTDPPRDRLEGVETVDAVFATPVETEAIVAALEGVEVLTAFDIISVTDRVGGDESAEPESKRDELTSEEAEDLSVDELLSEFDEFDDLDAAVEDVGDVDAFDDMGDAGTFDELLSQEELEEIDDADDDQPDREAETETKPTEDDEVIEDSNTVFNELKDEVEMVGFDELQTELEELEFEEFDDEVGMDELLGEVDLEDDDDAVELEAGDVVEDADDVVELEAGDVAEDADDVVELEAGDVAEDADDVVEVEAGDVVEDADDVVEVEADDVVEDADDVVAVDDDDLEDDESDEPETASAESSGGEDAFEFASDLEPAVPDEEEDADEDADTKEDADEDDAEPEEVTTDALESDDDLAHDTGWASSDDALEIEDTFDHTPPSDLGFEDEPLGSDFGAEDAFETPAEDSSLEADDGDWAVPSEDAGGFEPAESGFDPGADLEETAFGADDEPASEHEVPAVEPMEIPDITVPDREEPLEPEGEEETERIQSVRVNADQIDTLLTLVEGLVTSRVRLRNAVDTGEDVRAIDQELDGLEDITSDLQEAVVDVRLVPLETVTGRLPRVVRDIARDQGKEVDFELAGEDVELDRTVLERIGDPLIHLVRNAVDHGIEPPEEREQAGKPREGTVSLRAERERGRVVLEITDDGSGLDPDRLRSAAVDADVLTESEANDLSESDAYNLIFHPGLSTAEEVTDVSGRGVGMDVVKRTVDDLEGTISIESEPGEGTTVTLAVPVTVAISDVLFVQSGETEFGIPAKVIEDVEAVTAASVDEEFTTLEDGDEMLPLIELTETLETTRSRPREDGMVVRIHGEVRPVAIHCDDIRGQQEVVIKPFEGFMSDIPGLSGATVRGRGKVVNILDVKTL